MQQNLVPDLFVNLVNNPIQSSHARNYFKSKIFWKRIIKKNFKKVTSFFFPVQSLSIDKFIKKQKGPGTSDHWLFRLQHKFRKIPLLVMYYLITFDDVI